MSREGDYYKCSKRRPVVCREKATTASVVKGGQWYVARKRLIGMLLQLWFTMSLTLVKQSRCVLLQSTSDSYCV